MTVSDGTEYRRVLERTTTNILVNSHHNKSFAEDELPDLAALDAAGIELPLTEARLVLMLASRVIGHGHGKARSSLYVATSFIEMIVASRVPRPGGDSLEPLLDAPSATSIPDGKTALKRLGLDSSDISAAWAASSTFATSCLPLECVLAFLPAAAWPTVAAFVGCSADELSPRIDEALRRHGAVAGPARLRGDLTALRLLMRALADLRRELRAETESRSKRGAAVIDLPEGLESLDSATRFAGSSRARIKEHGRPWPPRHGCSADRADPRGACQPRQGSGDRKLAAARVATRPQLAGAEGARRAVPARHGRRTSGSPPPA